MSEQWFEEWQIGGVRVVRVIENEVTVPANLFFGDSELPDSTVHPWVVPRYRAADGRLVFSVHAFVVDDGQQRLIVDTCVGNDKQRTNPYFNRLDGQFLSRLEAVGYGPDTIDRVVCTHLHLDHVGWNTRLENGRWVPTFPNGRYLIADQEWNHSKTVVDDPAGPVVADSVAPLIEAGLVDLVPMDHQISDSVTLLPTPGHTPGHVAVVIRSEGRTAVITGDLIHHPVQVISPRLATTLDSDVDMARATRERFVADHTDCPVLVLGTHFGTPAGGHIISTPTGNAFLATQEERA